MRFGITPLEIENIVNVFKQGKGLESFLNFRFSDIVLDAAERGYKLCEITLDIFQILPVPVNDDEIQRLKDIKKKYNLTYSAHFPIWSIELASPNKFIRNASVDSLVDSYNIFKALEADIEVYVLHPSGPFAAEITSADIEPKYKDFILNLFNGFAIRSVKDIIKKTQIDKSKIAIVNIEYPFEGTLEIIKKLKGPKLLIDTAHFLGGYSGEKHSTPEGLVEIAKNHLDIISEIHLQDFASGLGADHAALGAGKGFPPKFLDIVHEYGFKGPIVFELTFDQAKESLNFIKKNNPDIVVPDIK